MTPVAAGGSAATGGAGTSGGIQLKARLITPHSVEFLKVHGIEAGPNYSNTTYGLTANGVMAQVSFGVADGEYYVEIDGKIHVDAKGVFDRHYASAAIEHVAFGDWAQDNDYEFALLFDDIKISIDGFSE